jgi:hypothetical protein
VLSSRRGTRCRAAHAITFVRRSVGTTTGARGGVWWIPTVTAVLAVVDITGLTPYTARGHSVIVSH